MSKRTKKYYAVSLIPGDWRGRILVNHYYATREKAEADFRNSPHLFPQYHEIAIEEDGE